MRFNNHSQLAGQHARLSASQNAWVNYTPEKMEASYRANLAAQRGTELHAHAAECIRLGTELKELPITLNMYVNDAIGYRMRSEQVLYYSHNSFGTADAIGFRDGTLRIFDLKTGMIEADVRQLEVYAALFCLEYKKNPMDLRDKIDLRIYQNDEIKQYTGDPDSIVHIMEHTKHMSKLLDQLRVEAMNA